MSDELYMREALKEAQRAFDGGEIPIGCIIVKDNQIIARGYNKKEHENNSLKHAEMIAIEEASKTIGWRLNDCHMYVTLEPCPMCAGAIIQSRIRRLIFGTKDPKAGAVGSKLDLLRDYEFNHRVEVNEGILEDECKELLQKFFRELRNK